MFKKLFDEIPIRRQFSLLADGLILIAQEIKTNLQSQGTELSHDTLNVSYSDDFVYVS